MRIPHFIPFSALFFFSCTNSLLDIEESAEISELVIPKNDQDSLTLSPIEISGPDSLEPIHMEHIEPPVNLRSKPNGSIIAQLEKEVCVHCSSEEFGSWKYIGLEIKSGYEIKKIVNHKSYLEIWDDDKKLATVYQPEKLPVLYADEYGESENYLKGYVYQNAIKTETVAEKVLEKYIQKGDLSLETMMRFLWDFDFENGHYPTTSDSIQTFYMHPAYVDGLSAPDRLALIFLHEKLVAVKHTRPVTIPGKKTYSCNVSGSLTILEKWDSERERQFIALFSDCAN